MKGVILTYVVAFGGSLLAVFRPYYGFLIFVTFAILRPEAAWGWAFQSSGRGFSKFLAGGVLLGWFLNGCGNWKLGKARAILLCLFGLWFLSLLSGLQAQYSFELAMGEVGEYGKILVGFVVGLTLIQTPRDLKLLAWVTVGTLGYLAYQFHEDYLFGGLNPDTWLYAALDRNGVALIMSSGAGLAFFMGLGVSKLWQKLLCLGLAGMMVHVVMFSMSRGGMLGLVAVAVASFILMPKRPVYLLAFAIALLIAARLAGPTVVERFLTIRDEQDGSAVTRWLLWEHCFDYIVQHPILGAGPKNWSFVSVEYWGHYLAAHSTWLEVGAESGLLALFCLIFFYLLCIVRLLRYTRDKTPVADPWMRNLARMVIVSLVGFIVCAFFVSVHGVENPYLIVLLGAGLLKVQYLHEKSAAPAGDRAALARAGHRLPMYGVRPSPHPVRI